MDEIRLPHHVVDRFERRWTGRFSQMLKGLQPRPRISRGGGDPIRSPEVRRLLQGSLRPPEPRTLGFGGA
jgi:hypothetical protein